MNSPPGYIAILARGYEGWAYEEDFERYGKLPPDARATIVEHLEKLKSGERGRNGDQPCIWLDPKTMGCRFYEHRPSICRNFEFAEEHCRNWRKEFNIFPY
jgi:Fe-S-cluster containining protein